MPGGARAVHERHASRELSVEGRPRDHEHRLDVEDDEQHGDHVELDGKSLARITEWRDAGFVGDLFDWAGARADGEMGQCEHPDRIYGDEPHQHENRKVLATHRLPAREIFHYRCLENYRERNATAMRFAMPNGGGYIALRRFPSFPATHETCPSSPIAGSARWRLSTV